MGGQAQKYEAVPESHAEIKRSCREARLSYHDPTIMHRLNLQVAIAEERFDDACMCAGLAHPSPDLSSANLPKLCTALSSGIFRCSAQPNFHMLVFDSRLCWPLPGVLLTLAQASAKPQHIV